MINFYKRSLCFIFSVLFFFINTFPVFAQKNTEKHKTVKVGYMNHPGFIEKINDKNYDGFCAEYLDEICKYTDWKIEYVPASWNDQLRMLEDGELDIVGMAQYTTERAKRFNYTRQSIGIFQSLLITLPEGQNDIKSNALSCDGKKIGVINGSKNIEYLEQYAARTHFSYDLLKYETQNQLNDALSTGAVDIIVGEQTVENNNLRVLDRFASDPYYFITAKSNPKLMEELDYVISMINAYDPSFSSRLHQKYYGNGLAPTSPYFTKKEVDFIKSHNKITLALIPDNQPLAYQNQNGEIVGIIPSIMNRISKYCDIQFKYKFIPKDTTPLAFLKDNPTYLGTGMLASNPAFKEENILRSDVYYTAYSALVTHGDNINDINIKTRNHTIGFPTSFQAAELFIKESYPHFQINKFLSVDEGLEALEKKEIDLFTYTLNNISPHLANPRYGDIQIIDSQFMPCPLCTIGENHPNNKLLIDIFNKCIPLLSDAEITQMENEHLRQNLYHFNDKDAFLRYQDVIFIIAFIIVLIISVLLLLFLLRQRKFNKDMIHHAEYDMMTGLYNRITFKKKTAQVLEQNKGIDCALLIMDIDNLNRINETYGHSIGDEVIKTVANIIREQFGTSNMIGRIGGDEFSAILIGVESKSVMVSILAKLQQTIGTTTISGIEIALGISIGVKMFVAGECSLVEISHHANDTLQYIKGNGKNGFAFYSSEKLLSNKSVFHQIRKDNTETTVSYHDTQPFIQEKNQDITGSHMGCDSDFRNILESSPNVALYVIEQKTHKILYYNKRFKEICPKVSLGINCRNIMFGPCKNCVVDTMKEQDMAHTIFYSNVLGDEVEITAKKIIWNNTIPAIMISSWSRNNLTSSNTNLPKTSNQDSFDFVTGGLTRQGFIHMMERMQSGGVDLTEYAVLFINIQDFKAVNELVGSQGGDNLLRTFFQKLEQSFLHPIIGARKESDHFVYLVEKSVLDLSKLSTLLNFHWQYEDRNLFIIARCGIFMIKDNTLDIYKMIDRAKLAKEHIVDEYVQPYAIYDSTMLKEYSEKAEAFLLFDHGIKNHEFIVYYQPIIDTKTQKIIGAEALVRRKTVDGTIVSPGKFIPILERTGYISMLDRFVGNEVRSFQQKMVDADLPIVPISFNLSQKDFYDTELMELLVSGFENNKFPKGSVLLEITESAYTLNEKDNKELLQRLRQAGAQILLDDFGTGYSSFGMFENYYFDRVKLDMSFVRQLSKNQKVKLVVESIIAMCHKLGVKVVAEGVETEHELAILREMECDYIQGYYFSKPLNEQDYVNYLKKSI